MYGPPGTSPRLPKATSFLSTGGERTGARGVSRLASPVGSLVRRFAPRARSAGTLKISEIMFTGFEIELNFLWEFSSAAVEKDLLFRLSGHSIGSPLLTRYAIMPTAAKAKRRSGQIAKPTVHQCSRSRDSPFF
jgi:hypothetical protein